MGMDNHFSLQGCTVVMAHPDDEALWASSVLRQAARIILCFGDIPGQQALSERRRKAMQNHPLVSAEHLDIAESGAFFSALWPLPGESRTGLRCRRNQEAYDANFQKLTSSLRDKLADSQVVVTHNPWGEYGHEEHVQVNRAVAHIQQELGYKTFVSGYCGNHSFLLMQRHLGRLGQPTTAQDTDTELAEQLKGHYGKFGCWTWSSDYTWPAQEVFFPLAVPEPSVVKPKNGSASMMNFIWTDSPLRIPVTLNPFG